MCEEEDFGMSRSGGKVDLVLNELLLPAIWLRMVVFQATNAFHLIPGGDGE